jgi:hypothetical protein
VLGDIKKRTERHVRRRLAPLSPVEREQLVSVTATLTRVLTPQGGDA